MTAPDKSPDVIRTVMNSLDAIVYVADMKSYEIVFANKYIEERFGAVAGRICWQTIQKSQTGPCPFCKNSELLDADGKPGGVVRWTHFNEVDRCWYDIIDRAIYWPDGRLVRIQIATDVSDRKEIERQLIERNEKLNTILKYSPDIIEMIDCNAGLMYSNIHHGKNNRNNEPSSILERFKPTYHRPFQDRLKFVADSGETVSFEYEDRGGHWWEAEIAPIVSGSDDECAMLISRDISERKDREAFMEQATVELEARIKERTEELNQTVRQLMQSEKMAALGFLVAGIAHEINNPNSFITFNIPILRDYLNEILPIVDRQMAGLEDYSICGMNYSDFREDILKLLDNMEHGSQRINTIVAHLKEFVGPGGDREFERVDLNRTITQGVALCGNKVRKMVSSFEINVEERLPEIYTIPQSIEQILINLLINAAQSSNKPDSFVELNVAYDSDQARILIDVIDNGCGISKRDLDKIFDPFFTTKMKIGIGLGLNITKTLTEELGGKIEVTSEPEKGSHFRLILPVSEEPPRKQLSG